MWKMRSIRPVRILFRMHWHRVHNLASLRSQAQALVEASLYLLPILQAAEDPSQVPDSPQLQMVDQFVNSIWYG